jgi:uncharacterized protein
MPLTQINLDSGNTFFYNNKTNLLYNEDRTVFKMFESGDHTDYEVEAKANYNSRKKSNRPAALRILMGHACNYSCTYCMQKDIGNPDELPKRKNLDSWFADIQANLDLSALDRIELWGGEPFLYWNDMVPLMEFFDKEGLTFAISTNGSCLSAKHAEFFGKLKSDVIVSISHDGPRQLELRGEEILTRARVISTLKLFDALPNVSYGFQCSLTDTNYDLFAINNFFRQHILDNDLNTKSLSFSLGRTYQELGSGKDNLGCQVIEPSDIKSDSTLHVIHGENLKKFRAILKEFLEQHYQQFTTFGFIDDEPAVYSIPLKDLPLLLCDIYESPVAYSVIEYSRKLLVQEPILETTNCGADMADILSLDLDGSIRTCPHAGEKYIHGAVNNLKGVRVVSLNLNRSEGHCSSCVNVKLCRSSCPLNLPDETFLTNCRVEKVWYGEIQKAAFRFIFGQQITSMEEVLA